MAKDIEIGLLFDFYGDLLTDKQRDVMALYYEEDLSLAEIAQTHGITRQGVRDSVKRAEMQMLELEEHLHLKERFGEMRQGFADICQAAEEIKVLAAKGGAAEEIDRLAQKIADLADQLKER